MMRARAVTTRATLHAAILFLTVATSCGDDDSKRPCSPPPCPLASSFNYNTCVCEPTDASLSPSPDASTNIDASLTANPDASTRD